MRRFKLCCFTVAIGTEFLTYVNIAKNYRVCVFKSVKDNDDMKKQLRLFYKPLGLKFTYPISVTVKRTTQNSTGTCYVMFRYIE